MAYSTGTITVVDRGYRGKKRIVDVKLDITSQGTAGLQVTPASIGLQHIHNVFFSTSEGKYLYNAIPEAAGSADYTQDRVGGGGTVLIVAYGGASAQAANFALAAATTDVGVSWWRFEGV